VWYKTEKLYGIDFLVIIVWGLLFSMLFSIFSPALVFVYPLYIFIKPHWSVLWIITLIGTIFIIFVSFKLSLRHFIPMVDRKKGVLERIRLPFWLVYFSISNICAFIILFLDAYVWKHGIGSTLAHMMVTMFGK
jgi:hypothetical protein